MNISQLLISYNNKSGEQNNHANVVAAKAIMEVIQNQLLNLATFFTFTISCGDRHTCAYHNNLMQKLFHMLGLSAVQFLVRHTNSKIHVSGKRNFNLILIDSYKSFRDIDIASYIEANNYNEYYYMFIQIRDHLLLNELRQIFKYCWDNSMINCSVQSQDAHGEIFVHSYLPFHANSCSYLEPVLVSRFNGSAFVNPELFPSKLTNLYGCVVRAALWHAPPYVYLDTDSRGESRIVSGFEGYLLRLLAERLNFTIDIKVPLRGVKCGSMAQRVVNRREVDLTLGGFAQSSQLYGRLSHVSSYYQTRQIMAVAKAAYRLTSKEMIISPFDWLIWLLIWFACTVCHGLHYLMSKYCTRASRGSKQPFLNFLAIMLGLPTTYTPDASCERLHFTAWLLFTLISRAIYQGILFSYIHGDIIVPPPTDFKDLIDQNFTTVMTASNQVYLTDVMQLDALPSVILTSSHELSAFEYILEKHQRDFVAVGTVDILYLYRREYKQAGVFVVMNDDLIDLQITMYLSKHSFLTAQFEAEIWWMRSAGLVEGWVSKVLGKQNTVKIINDFDADLGIEDLYACFAILALGLGLSMMVFILEYLSPRIQFLRRWLLKLHD
ncbi:uncharacterized protein LOC118734683 [Rhagoletis pomonella]|uniref:uncharacterized protein LOC118734683 n=1 Tax=Rhagoletis pomonella TaxID=28610 RepID=UPI001781662F|nr:uncharacterized protein LOC118734683 [Rhagoletis pomonella]